MPTIRVLYDISALGLGGVSEQRRGGSYRADRHLVEYLAGSAECELVFCANYTSLAYDGCVKYLRGHSTLGHVPLLLHDESWIRRGMREAIALTHRSLKIRRGDRPLPHFVRACGTLVDTHVRRPVVDAVPPADIHHSSTTPLPPPPKRRRRVPRRFVTIYDLRATWAHHMPAAEAAYQRAILASVREDDWVLTSSESTRRALCGVGIDESRIRVVPLAADRYLFHVGCNEDPAEVRARHGIPPGPYLLALKSRSPRKNIGRAVEAFARLVEQNTVGDLSLVLAGAADESESASPAGGLGPAVQQRVFSVGHVTDPELASLYRSATAFVYPSLYEGFGLPPLEAMQCGTPVITSNTSSLPEVVADAGLMVDPGDVDALADAMLALSRDATLRAALRAKGLVRAATFSWERTAACTIAAYRAALDS
jgi:glycosyltransferase involved in cell wall biosynthesis